MHPVSCYDESQFDSREEMVSEAMSIFEPPAPVAVEDPAHSPAQ
jgi:hypothetical protein